MKNNLKIQLILGLLLTFFIFISFYIHEHGDMNVVIFGAFLYIPCVLILCIYNGLIIGIFEKINKKERFINYCIPVIPLLIWYIVSGKEITIRYLDIAIDTKIFFISLAILLLTDILGYIFITSKK